MNDKSILALVVANTGSLQNGLLAIITTLPQIKSSLVAEDVVSALKLIEVHQPALVILDEDQLMAQEAIKQIRSKWPKIHIIALISDIEQEKNLKKLGADVVLVKGFTVKKLIDEVDNLFRL